MFTPHTLTLLVLISSFLCLTLVAASPVEDKVELDVAYWRGIQKRNKMKAYNPDDEDNFEIQAQLDPVRKAIDYASLYWAQSTATLTTISIGASPADATFTTQTAVTSKPDQNGPLPTDTVQGTTWQVDHILELQILVGAFSVQARPTASPTSIATDVWSSVSLACFTSKKGGYLPQQTIASALSNLDNLEAIPDRVNNLKQQVFTGRINNKTKNPSNSTYPTDFGKALQKLLTDRQRNIFDIIGGVGDALADPSAGGIPEVKTYFTSYAQAIIANATDFLSSWTGKTGVYTTTSTSTTAAAANTTTAAVTCYHAADPQNTCSDIANGPGWCDCGDANTYAVIATGAPCAGYTAHPVPTTSFDCTPHVITEPLVVDVTPTTPPAPNPAAPTNTAGARQ